MEDELYFYAIPTEITSDAGMPRVRLTGVPAGTLIGVIRPLPDTDAMLCVTRELLAGGIGTLLADDDARWGGLVRQYRQWYSDRPSYLAEVMKYV